jgi:type II secretory pathway component PulK
MGRRDQGYAMIAAVASVAVFGYLALGALKGGHSAIVAASADMSHARLSAAADAGAAIAVHDLGLVDPRRRWSLSDSPHTLDFDDVHLTIAIEDENGKLPINFLRADQIRRLFEQARADPRRIDGLVEAFLDLRGDAKPNDAGAGGGFARIDSRIERERGPLTSLDELELLPGMTPELYARIAPAATVYASTLSFDPRTASPLALAVMAPS